MSNFFDNVMNDLPAMEDKILGPSYEYYKFIRTPKEMGMSSHGSLSTIARNVDGLIAYTEILVSGGGKASVTGKPLGNKYFLKTGAQCKDKETGNQVNRYIYVNNVPDGSIPFISSGMGVNFTEFEGLLPGTMSNLAQINPLGIFQAFMMGDNSECQSLEMETIDTNNNVSKESQHVLTSDIKNMNPCWFSNKTNPVTNTRCREAFENPKTNEKNTLYELNNFNDSNIDYLKNLINVLYFSLLIILFLSIANKSLKR